MSTHYRLDIRKMTYRECWNVGSVLGILMLWPAKFLGVAIPMGSGIPHPGRQRERELLESQLPAEVVQRLWKDFDEFRRLGFYSPRYFGFQTRLGETASYSITMMHTSGTCVARLFCTIANNPPIRLVKCLMTLVTELRDGQFLVGSTGKPQFLSSPGVSVHRLVGGTPGALFGRHEKKVAELVSTNPARLVTTHEQVDDICDKYESHCFESSIKRGLYTPI